MHIMSKMTGGVCSGPQTRLETLTEEKQSQFSSMVIEAANDVTT